MMGQFIENSYKFKYKDINLNIKTEQFFKELFIIMIIMSNKLICIINLCTFTVSPMLRTSLGRDFLCFPTENESITLSGNKISALIEKSVPCNMINY